jgi:hypothetical protein
MLGPCSAIVFQYAVCVDSAPANLQAISKPSFWSSKLLILMGLDEILKLALDGQGLVF